MFRPKMMLHSKNRGSASLLALWSLASLLAASIMTASPACGVEMLLPRPAVLPLQSVRTEGYTAWIRIRPVLPQRPEPLGIFQLQFPALSFKSTDTGASVIEVCSALPPQAFSAERPEFELTMRADCLDHLQLEAIEMAYIANGKRPATPHMFQPSHDNKESFAKNEEHSPPQPDSINENSFVTQWEKEPSRDNWMPLAWPMASGESVTKDWRYLLKLELGLPEDQRWRRSEDAGRMVLQAVAPVAAPERIRISGGELPEIVQFSFADHKGNRRIGFLLWHELQPAFSPDEKGSIHLTLHIGDALRAKGYDPQNVMLLEPIFFFRDFQKRGVALLADLHCEASTKDVSPNALRPNVVRTAGLVTVRVPLPARHVAAVRMRFQATGALHIPACATRIIDTSRQAPRWRLAAAEELRAFGGAPLEDIQSSRLAGYAYTSSPPLQTSKRRRAEEKKTASLPLTLMETRALIQGTLWAYSSTPEYSADLQMTVQREGKSRRLRLPLRRQATRLHAVRAGDRLLEATVISKRPFPSGTRFLLVDVEPVRGVFNPMKYRWLSSKETLPADSTMTWNAGSLVEFKTIRPGDTLQLKYPCELPLSMDISRLPSALKSIASRGKTTIRPDANGHFDFTALSPGKEDLQLSLTATTDGLYTFTPPALRQLGYKSIASILKQPAHLNTGKMQGTFFLPESLAASLTDTGRWIRYPLQKAARLSAASVRLSEFFYVDHILVMPNRLWGVSETIPKPEIAAMPSEFPVVLTFKCTMAICAFFLMLFVCSRARRLNLRKKRLALISRLPHSVIEYYSYILIFLSLCILIIAGVFFYISKISPESLQLLLSLAAVAIAVLCYVFSRHINISPHIIIFSLSTFSIVCGSAAGSIGLIHFVKGCNIMGFTMLLCAGIFQIFHE